MVLNNTSIVKFDRDKYGHMLVSRNFKVFNKEVKYEKNFWQIKASHDAYSKSNGVIHEREIQYFPETIHACLNFATPHIFSSILKSLAPRLGTPT